MPRGQAEQLTPAICLSTHFSLKRSVFITDFIFYPFSLYSHDTRHQIRHLTNLAGQRQEQCTLPAVVTKVSRSSPAERATNFCCVSELR